MDKIEHNTTNVVFPLLHFGVLRRSCDDIVVKHSINPVELFSFKHSRSLMYRIKERVSGAILCVTSDSKLIGQIFWRVATVWLLLFRYEWNHRSSSSLDSISSITVKNRPWLLSKAFFNFRNAVVTTYPLARTFVKRKVLVLLFPGWEFDAVRSIAFSLLFCLANAYFIVNVPRSWVSTTQPGNSIVPYCTVDRLFLSFDVIHSQFMTILFYNFIFQTVLAIAELAKHPLVATMISEFEIIPPLLINLFSSNDASVRKRVSHSGKEMTAYDSRKSGISFSPRPELHNMFSCREVF